MGGVFFSRNGRESAMGRRLRRRMWPVAAVLAGLAFGSPAAAQETGGGMTPIGPAVIQPLASKSLILDATRAGDRLVAVGERGHILLSDDGGQSWRQVPVPADSTLTGVHFADAQHGWAVGHDSVILATSDGGESWILQHAMPEWEQPLMDVLFTDPQTGVAVGAYGLYMETRDGGQTWEDRRVLESEDGMDFHYNAILAPGPDLRLIAGEAGLLLVSADRGASWTQLESPYDGSFFDALALDERTWLAYGLQGHISRTEDGGQSWTDVPSHTTAGLMGGARLEDGRVVLVGLQGVVLTSEDGGRSFTLSQRGDRVALADAAVAANGDLILLGEQGALPPIPAASHKTGAMLGAAPAGTAAPSRL